MTRVHGGKTWMAPKVLIREDVRVVRLVLSDLRVYIPT